MSKCLNCNKNLSCGCKKRTASDGKSCCSDCLSSYEAGLKKLKTTTANNVVIYKAPKK